MKRRFYRIKLLSFIVIFFIGTPAICQQMEGLEYITIEHGLSQGMIYDQLQDQEGFIWIGTKDGLNRYDGYNFKVFTNDPYNPNSISSNAVVLLFEDSRGLLWIVTESAGLNVYNKRSGRFHRFQHKVGSAKGISGDKIRCIEEDVMGNILVTVDHASLNVIQIGADINGTNFEHSIKLVPLPEGFYIKGIVKDSRGRVWIGGNDNAIYRLEQDDYSLTRALEGYSFTHAIVDPVSGHVYASARDQTPFFWDGANAFQLFDSLWLTLELALHPDGTLWIANYNGLFSIEIRNWDHKVPMIWSRKPYTEKYLFFMFSLIVDRSGLIWVGTGGYGLIKINPFKRKFNHILPGFPVRTILPRSKDELVLGRYWSKWAKLKDKQVDTSYFGRIFPFTEIDNLMFTRNGDILAMSVSAFIHVYKSGKRIEIPLERSISWDKHLLLEDKKARIWIAGFDGDLRLYIPGSQSFKLFNYQDKANPLPPLSPATSLYVDGQGTFWFGTQLGFVRGVFDEQSETFEFEWFRNNLNDRNSLNYNHVSCFLDDPILPERYLWICTKGGGLNRFDKMTGDFLHVTTKQGLLNDVVYGLLTDESGNIWGSTNRGIFCMSPDTISDKNQNANTISPKWIFRNFNKNDGLQEDEFNTGAYAKLPDGRLAFGGVNGLNIFNPKDLFSSDFVPNVVITRLLVNNRELLPNEDSSILSSTIETSENIVLNHLQNVVTIEFAALDFTSPSQNKYRYQLVGADPDWVESDTRRSATYLHLPPGNYIFRVQGSNSRGIWGDQITELQIKVLPPWWRTWWAYGLYLVFIGMAIRTYFLFSLNREKLKAQLDYETREAERVKELDVAKTKLYTNITHEFRTPLTIILGMANQIKEKPAEHLQSGIDMIMRNGKSLLKLVNELLDLSKLESGKMELYLIQGDVIVFLRYIVESFSSMAESQKKYLHFLPEADNLVCAYDSEKLRQIVSNLLSNALKFTPEGGHIYMTTGKLVADDDLEKGWFIKVKDTGIGIPEEQITSIFDRFYQADSGHTRQEEGSGIGLALTRELVKLMNGEIMVKSPPSGANKGSEFTVLLPMVTNALNSQQDSLVQEKIISDEISAIHVSIPISNDSNDRNVAQVSDKQVPLLLLVEDNQDVVAYTASCLQEYRLIVGQNGQEGLEIALNVIPDLIISDVMMPIMDGFEMIRKIREDKTTSHIPAIMLTAKADMESRLQGISSGADAYLPKPFNREELILRINKLLEMRSLLQQHYLQSAGLAEVADSNNDTNVQNIPEHAFVSRVKEIIDNHLSDSNFDVEQLSREVHLSYRQLQRKLDALTGCSPNIFIRRIRLNHAKNLFANPDLSVAEVALECGFQDPGYFARVFKQEHGVSPVEWRQNQMNKN